MSAPMEDGWWHRPERQGHGLRSRIMLTAVLSLGFIVLLVIVLHLYARYVLRRYQARRRARTGVFFHTGVVGVNDAASTEPARAGLHPSVISALPIFSYKNTAAHTAEKGSAAECAVCLCALEEGEVARLLPNCSHLFHVGCIDMWLGSHSTCPICRAEAEPAPVAAAETAQQPEQHCSNSAPLEVVTGAAAAEGTSGSCKDQEEAASRLNSSLRRMLSRGRSQRAVQTDVVEDLERQ